MNSSAAKSFLVHDSKNTTTTRQKVERSGISLGRKLPAVLRHGWVLRPQPCFACCQPSFEPRAWGISATSAPLRLVVLPYFSWSEVLEWGFWLVGLGWQVGHVFSEDSSPFQCSSLHFGCSWACILRAVTWSLWCDGTLYLPPRKPSCLDVHLGFVSVLKRQFNCTLPSGQERITVWYWGRPQKVSGRFSGPWSVNRWESLELVSCVLDPVNMTVY